MWFIFISILCILWAPFSVVISCSSISDEIFGFLLLFQILNSQKCCQIRPTIQLDLSFSRSSIIHLSRYLWLLHRFSAFYCHFHCQREIETESKKFMATSPLFVVILMKFSYIFSLIQLCIILTTFLCWYLWVFDHVKFK